MSQTHGRCCAGLEAQLAAAALCVCAGPQRPQGDAHPDVAGAVHPAMEPVPAIPHDQVRSSFTPVSHNLPVVNII